MKKIRKIYSFILKQILFNLLSLLNFIIPKSQYEVFISDKRLRKDNSWAIAQYLSNNIEYNKYKIFYYTKREFANEKNITYISSSIHSLWRQLRASYIFYSYRDVTLFRPVRNQKIVDTMHGSPLKNIGYLLGNSRFKRLWRYENTYSHILCVSQFFKDIVQKSFGAAENQCLVLGYPRNDIIFSDNDSLKNLGIEKDLYSKVVLFMPTFRYRDENNRNIDSESDFPVLNSDNIDSVNQFLNEENILLIIKPHPNQLDLDFLNRIYANVKILKNEDLAASNVELYQIFSKVDALLTDYSSVYFDFLLTMKPIGYVIDDWNSYKDNHGFTVAEPFSIMPGDKIFDLQGFTRFLSDLNQGVDGFYNERRYVNDIVNKYQDGNSCKRIVEHLNM